MNKEQQIEEMAVIGCVRNPQAHTAEECAKCDFKNGHCNSYRHAEALYNAGYRKTFTSDTQKAYKEGYIKGIEETEAEIERLKADNEALQMWNNASAETIQKLSETNKRFASNMKSVLEIEKKNAVKEFVEKLKAKAHSVVGFDVLKKVYAKEYTIDEIDIDELLEEYE